MPEGNAGERRTPKRTIFAGVCLVGALGVVGCTVGSQGTEPSDSATSSTPLGPTECTGAISEVEWRGIAGENYRYLVKNVALDDCVPLLSSHGEETIGKIVTGDFVVAVCDANGGGASTGSVGVNHEPMDYPPGARDVQEGTTYVSTPVLAQMIDNGLKACADPSVEA